MITRVAIVTNDEKQGGPNKVAQRLHNIFKADYTTKMVIQGAGYTGFDTNDALGYFRLPKSNSYFFMRFLIGEFSKFKNTVYFCFGTKQSLILCVVKIIMRDRFRLVIRTGLNEKGSKRKKGDFFKDYLQLALCKRLYPLADAIVTETSSVKEWWLQQVENTTKVHQINNPVRKMTCDEDDIQYVRQLVKHDHPVLLSIGRLSYQKDHEFLLRSFKIFLSRYDHPDAVMVILGEGPAYDELTDLINSQGLRDRVKLLGHVDNVLPFLKVCNIFCLTSRWEGGVNSLIEAIYYGAKVVALDCPVGPADILNNFPNGFLVKERCVETFAECLNASLNHSTSNEGGTSTDISREYEDEFIRSKYVRLINRI